MAGHVRTLVAIGDPKAKGCRYVSGGKPEIQSVRDRHKFHVTCQDFLQKPSTTNCAIYTR